MTTLVYHRHYRELRSRDGKRLCNSAAREFCKKHQIDWYEFVTIGVPEEKLIATNDHFALLTVEQARKEWAARVSHL